MKALRRCRARLLGSLFGNRREAELTEEIETHIEMQTEDNLRLGMSREAALRAARLKFGGADLTKELYREQRGLPWLDVLGQNLRYGMRQLRRNPGFTVVVVVTLGLGIGANTAVFSVMNAAMMRFLPVRAPQRLMFLNTTFSFGSQSGDGDTSLTESIFEQLRERRDILSDLVAYAPVSAGQTAVRYGSRQPEEALVEMVSGDFFSGLGVQPATGRTFSPDDEKTHAPLAVLSYGYWSRRLGSDRAAIGQTISIKGVPFTVIGVAARGFIGVESKQPTDLWIPLQTRDDLQPWGQPAASGLSLYGSAHTWWCLKEIARVREGLDAKSALARLEPIFERAALEGTTRSPKLEKPKVYFTPVRGVAGLRDEYRDPLTVLMAMAGLVLMIACANVAMLMVARNAARQREFSMRTALGASRRRLLGQLLAESALLVAAGGALAWVFAIWATSALSAWAHLELNLRPDGTVLAFALGLCVLTGAAFGLAPLRSIVRVPVALALRASAASVTQDRGKLRSGQVVVALQMALCLVLMAGAGLLLRTLRNLQNTDLGIRTQGLFVFGLGPQNVRSDAEAVRFYEEVLRRMRALPAVEGATLMYHRVGSGWRSGAAVLVDGASPGGNEASYVRWNGAGSDYFRVMGTPMLSGRDFTAADTAQAPPVAIVNQTFARLYLHGLNPVGHLLTRGDSAPCTIVGMVRNNKYASVTEEEQPMAWFPYAQTNSVRGLHVEVRARGDAAAIEAPVRSAMQQFAPDLPLLQPMTQQEQFERSFSEERLVARLAIFFGLLAALLVATGLYGTLSYAVSRRTAEVGIRMALGAARGQVLWMVLRSTLVVTGAGLAIGLPLAVAGARLLRSMLFGVQPGDPWIFASATAGLALVALGASVIPARRAASVDPIVALRSE